MLTLGHGTASADEIAALIDGAAIASLVDVRTVPKSRRHPHFWREELQRWVPAQTAATYGWEPELGGFRKVHSNSSNVALRHPSFRAYADYMETPEFAAALANLLAHAAATPTAIMCSESVWWRCHRRLIADAAVLLHSVEVQHLMHDGKLRPHIPTSGVRVAQDGKLRYDLIFEADSPLDEHVFD